MKYSNIYFEDFKNGRVFETDTEKITTKEIISFGKNFAPLPYHTDPEAAKDYMFGELGAAGFHTCSISFGLLFVLVFLMIAQWDPLASISCVGKTPFVLTIPLK